MKPPILPGTEKFKFSDKKFSDRINVNVSHNNDKNSSNLPHFIRGLPSRSTCPSNYSTPCLTFQPTISRFDSKRKPILPISSRMACRVLTLTQLPLDSFDIRLSDLDCCARISKKHNNYINSAINRTSFALRTPTMTLSSRVSLFSDTSGSSTQPSPRSLGSGLGRSATSSHWVNNCNRRSTSSHSSWDTTNESCPQSVWTKQ